MAVDLAGVVELTQRDQGYRVVQGDESVDAASAAALVDHPESALLGLVAVALDLPPVEIRVRSESPRGAGLGASSSVVMAAIAAADALLGRDARPPESACALGRDLEARLMALPTGRQDQWAALLGGALEIVYAPGSERPRRLEVDLERLGGSLMVAYSGQSHFSAGNNWQVVKRRLDGEPDVVDAFEGIAAAATSLAPALEAGDLSEVGRLMSVEWSHRRRLAPEVSTPRVEALLAAALDAGAWGAKVCGAGGGGCLAVLSPPERREAVGAALESAGARILECRPAPGPLEVRVAGG